MSETTSVFVEILLGSITIIAGIIMIFRNKSRKRTCTSIANAKVIDILEREENEEYETISGRTEMRLKTYYCPEFEYTVDGKTYKKSFSTYSNIQNMKIGDELTIYYNPSNPTQVDISARYDNSSVTTPIILICVGILLLAVAIFTILNAF